MQESLIDVLAEHFHSAKTHRIRLKKQYQVYFVHHFKVVIPNNH